MLNQAFTLPCGSVLSNRLAKSATTERLSRPDLSPNEWHTQLYDRWADTRAGLLVTGNIIVDRRHLESAGNVVISKDQLPKFRSWVEAGKKHDNHLWAQLSHAGRQTTLLNNWRPLSASGVQLKKMGLFNKPRPMKAAEIEQVVEQFTHSAVFCREAGFTGVQIHSAHGYLLSQFLSPITNKRTDEWGGSLENRARLLRTIIQRVRKALGADYPISVKLNSADFQRGGFTEDESSQVIRWLEEDGVDLLEISGGTYEKMAFFERYGSDGRLARESTRQREAYFIDFARKVRKLTRIPLMATGGVRSYDFCVETLQSGAVDMIGLARPFIIDSDNIAGFIEGKVSKLMDVNLPRGLRLIQDSAEGGYYARQLIRLAQGKSPAKNTSVFFNANYLIWHELKKAAGNRFLG